MRVITEFAIGETAKATIFVWNGKYIIKIEMGNLEQTYKVSELDIISLSELQTQLQSTDFQKKTMDLFAQMENVHATLMD